MKKHKLFGIFVFLILAGIPLLSHAATLKRNFAFGGKVISTPTDLESVITCAAAYGPFIARPYNLALPGPYFIRATTHGTPARNGYILSLYNVVPDVGTCVNPETGVPIPAFEIKLYGVSR